MFRAFLGFMLCLGFACVVLAGENGVPPRNNPTGQQLTEEQQKAMQEISQLMYSLQPLRQKVEQSSEMKATQDAVLAAQEAMNKAMEPYLEAMNKAMDAHKEAVVEVLRKDSDGKENLEKIDALKAKLPDSMHPWVDIRMRHMFGAIYQIPPGTGGNVQ